MALLYHFNSARHGLNNIENERLKIAIVSELNDPFELLPARVVDPGFNDSLATMRAELVERIGILCFSQCWKHSLMWGHYADSHRGICLGFERTGPTETCFDIGYSDQRLEISETILKSIAIANIASELCAKFPRERELVHAAQDRHTAETQFNELYKELIRTKSSDWRYENEVRIFTWLDAATREEINGKMLLFENWAESLKLREVILGLNCKLSVTKVISSISDPNDVSIYRTVLHRTKFELERQLIQI